LRQILDFVPNHMGIGGADNPWWLDVLEWGPESEFAAWFDIDWNPDSPYLKNKVLVPFLGEQYGLALEAGKLRFQFDAAEGSFAVWAYGHHKLPISPFDYEAILGDQHPALERIGDEFASVGREFPQATLRVKELKSTLVSACRESSEVLRAVEAAVASYRGEEGVLSSWTKLDQLIQRQNWRPAYFRVATDDINYRRFFNISDLAGVRMEVPGLFERAHQFLLRLLNKGMVDGLRIDHIDGLFDPLEYLERLRESSDREFYLAVEKILAPHESLAANWPVQGTTGYDFLNQVLGLLINPDGEDSLTTTYEEFTGHNEKFEDIVRQSKVRIIDNEMAAELRALGREAARVARQNPTTADFTQNILRRALRQIIACFPVYRTYVSEDRASENDRRYIDWAVSKARIYEPEFDDSVFEFLRDLLTGDLVGKPHSGFSRHAVLQMARKFQQFSGPAMAKGFEDTALYRYSRLLALNEVGGSPDQFGISISAFHKANAARANNWPSTMLATATHDTKLGEDVRARLAVLSEIPAQWAQQVNAWSRLLRVRRGDLEAAAPPARDDEYLFYQLLLGSWPPELSIRDSSGRNGGSDSMDRRILGDYVKRLQGAVRKAIREARIHSGWIKPDINYETAVFEFIRDALNPERSEAFLSTFRVFEAEVARYGVQNSLVQLVLKLTSPGMPDIYQGSELWDLNLVDPDNRRPVDYAKRREKLCAVRTAFTADRRGALRKLLANWHDGSVKLAVLNLLLDVRRSHQNLFQAGGYEPLTSSGPLTKKVLAFARRFNGEVIVVAAKLFSARTFELSEWKATSISLPEDSFMWKDVFTHNRAGSFPGGRCSVDLLFDQLPVAVLSPEK